MAVTPTPQVARRPQKEVHPRRGTGRGYWGGSPVSYLASSPSMRSSMRSGPHGWSVDQHKPGRLDTRIVKAVHGATSQEHDITTEAVRRLVAAKELQLTMD